MSPADRKKIGQFLKAIQAVRRLYPRMEMGQLEVFLLVYLNPGISGVEIAAAMEDITKSGVTKALLTLSDDGRNTEEGRTSGLELIFRRKSEASSRVVENSPGPQGNNLAASISAALSQSPMRPELRLVETQEPKGEADGEEER